MAVDLGGYFNAFAGIAWMVVKIFLIMGVIGVVGWWVWNRKKYDTKTIEIETDPRTGTIVGIRMGKAGTFVDSKTQNKRFFVKKGMVGMASDNVPILPILNSRALDKKNVVLIARSGEKHLSFIRPFVNSNKSLSWHVEEEDVNWGGNTYERLKKAFGTSLWDKFLPWLPLIFGYMISLIIVVYIFKQLPQMKEILEQLVQITSNINQANMGTVIT